jgi:FhuF 2Fe-2S C-terminal domain
MPLAAAARFGPYFVWEPYDGGVAWLPFADLSDGSVLDDRVGAARAMLARMSGASGVPERVVASVWFLGLASRVVSPLLGAVVTGGGVPTPAALWWRPVDSGPIPVAYRGSATGDDFPGTAVRLIAPVLDAVGRRFHLSGHVLWGNVASALGGAAAMIGPAAARPVADALSRPPLRGRATFAGGRLRRRNCCLYYRIPGGGTCGDCILRAPAAAR